MSESAERHCGTLADNNPEINSTTRAWLHSCQRKTIAGSGSTLSCINVIFFSPPAEQHNWRQKDQSEPGEDNHTLTKEIIVFCSRTGQLRAWDTNVTFFSDSYSEAMCLFVNCFALAFVSPVMMQNLIETSRDFRTVPDCLAGSELLMASTKPPLLKGSLQSCPAHW